ncbi:MAG: antibiotic biosynthesis monooxygenase [Phycisphaerae bacterium]|nr:antibiotic biosynthesis monooxygenase [Gemmatimonadaceae bacterium]
MSQSPVVVTIRYNAQPAQATPALNALTSLIKTVVSSEADCLGIQVLQDPDDETRILLYERWTSREAYAGPHMQTPHLGAFMVAARELFAGPPTIEYWHLKSDETP